jgi:hypothetical protein
MNGRAIPNSLGVYQVTGCSARHASIPHMLERFGNVLYRVCAIAAVGLTAIMLATVLTHGGPYRDRNRGRDWGVDLVHWLGPPLCRVGAAMNAFASPSLKSSKLEFEFSLFLGFGV